VKYAAGFTVVALLAAAAAGLALASRQADAQSPVLRRGQEVPICHSTRLRSQPYVSQSPDVDGVLDGHD
jgi:ABC-type sugar transport system substrate-binding protein